MVEKPDFTSLEKKILEALDSIQIFHFLQKLKVGLDTQYVCQMQQAANMDFLNGLARN